MHALPGSDVQRPAPAGGLAARVAAYPSRPAGQRGWWQAVVLLLQAGAVVVASSAVGLAVNALRPTAGLPLRAPFPYQFDCPDPSLAIGPSPEVDAAALAAILGRGDTAVVDARAAEAYAAGHIAGSRSLPYSPLDEVDPQAVAPLRRLAHVVVYCDLPDLLYSTQLAAELRRSGLPDVKVLRGGLGAWTAAGRQLRPGREP